MTRKSATWRTQTRPRRDDRDDEAEIDDDETSCCRRGVSLFVLCL
jgi:hypothetical protein